VIAEVLSPAVWTSIFVERESLEHRLFQAFLERESPACEVVLSCNASQAAILTARRRGRAKVLVVQGGLADGRAADFLARLRAQDPSISWVAFVDRRHCRGPLAEPRLEELENPLRALLADGWLLVRFLEPRR
jgi:hypothetical protein